MQKERKGEECLCLQTLSARPYSILDLVTEIIYSSWPLREGSTLWHIFQPSVTCNCASLLRSFIFTGLSHTLPTCHKYSIFI